ncbi:hypothetical protein AB0F25_34005 [Streptomyces wedmorensis]|uniref:Uncharacterized protein n=1 Tax=Streptomyces wedmorensis TaxID=43759 RepID=A0ABW6IQ87_STRWE|nr:hypothetical protein [Streptomyces sp. SS]
MSTAPAHGPRDAKRPGTASSAENTSKPVLVFDDPLDQQSADDTDRGWGERPPSGGDSAADLARFLDEKPPHHL